jgi:DNA polymerase epsilon subunit 1
VELKLHHLAVCAVDKAQMLAELEGAGDSAGGATFRTLAALVANWLADATRHSNPIADHLLQNLYR